MPVAEKHDGQTGKENIKKKIQERADKRLGENPVAVIF